MAEFFSFHPFSLFRHDDTDVILFFILTRNFVVVVVVLLPICIRGPARRKADALLLISPYRGYFLRVVV